MIVLITEKPIRYIEEEKTDKIINIAQTFIPFWDEVKEEFRYTGEIIQKVKELKEKYHNEIYVLIGYDFDENGIFLSEILRKELLNFIPEEYIFRTPLTEKNFIMFTDFPNLKEYMEYRKTDIKFIKKQKKEKIKHPIGILKIIGLYFLYTKKNQKFKPNNGTSTFTFLHKFLHKEDKK